MAADLSCLHLVEVRGRTRMAASRRLWLLAPVTPVTMEKAPAPEDSLQAILLAKRGMLSFHSLAGIASAIATSALCRQPGRGVLDKPATYTCNRLYLAD